MRYGKCKTCWWYEPVKMGGYRLNADFTLTETTGEGNCYMRGDNDNTLFHVVKEDSYCPDHANRKKQNKESGMKLDEWILKCKTPNEGKLRIVLR